MSQGVKSQYSSEVSSLQEKLDASLSKEAEAQEMVKTLREIVQKDVARLRTELSQVGARLVAMGVWELDWGWGWEWEWEQSLGVGPCE